jgi:hypothetical protein
MVIESKHLTEKQGEAITKIIESDSHSGIIWWKIGEGKTRIALAWMLCLFKDPRPLIVCAPQAERQWKDEVKLLGLDNRIKLSFYSSGLLSRRKVITDIDFARINCVVVDELWMYKNPKSKRSTAARQLTYRKPSIGLSGSLMTAGNIEDLYGQAKAMNLDDKIATSLTSFRKDFMIETNSWAGFIQRYPRRGAVESIQRRLFENIHVNFPKEVREIRDIPVNVEPSYEQLKYRKELKKNYAIKEGNFQLEVKNAVSLLIKLQQVSDGFIKDGEGNYLSIRSNKMDRLIELCTELLDSRERILIWVAFKKTAEILSNALPCKTTILSGDGKFDVFGWREGKVKATIATVGSGSSLNDFANIRYSIFYSTSFSNINFQQSKGRTNRKSSLQNCNYYYFLATDKFPDRRIYEMIEANKTREEIAIEISTKILKEKL